MGRTNPTFRDVLRALESRWGPYRRTLRRRDQDHFDALFEHARDHADAASQLNHESPIVPVLVAACLTQERRIAQLESRLDELRSAIESDPRAPADTNE